METMDQDNKLLHSVKEIFDNAFIECSIDDKQLVVLGQYRYRLEIANDKYIRLSITFGTGDGVGSSDCSMVCERVNREMIVLRLFPTKDYGAVVMDWYLPILGELNPKIVVLGFREFDSLVLDAIERAKEIL